MTRAGRRDSGGHSHNPVVRYFSMFGLCLVTGASNDDPSGTTTYSIAGASLGYGMLWTAIVTLLLIAAIQLASARLGVSSHQAAEGLRPLAGETAYLLFAVGLIGAGLLAIPVVLVMLVGNNRKIMRAHINGPWLNVLGWTATAIHGRREFGILRDVARKRVESGFTTTSPAPQKSGLPKDSN